MDSGKGVSSQRGDAIGDLRDGAGGGSPFGDSEPGRFGPSDDDLDDGGDGGIGELHVHLVGVGADGVHVTEWGEHDLVRLHAELGDPRDVHDHGDLWGLERELGE